MNLSLKQLKYLCALAEHRHFGKAANSCHVTQSTLSAAIAELESQLGVVIFERSKKSVLITPLGERLLQQARIVLGDVEDFVGLAKAHEEALSGEIRLGVIPTIGPFLLPPVLSALRKSHEKLRLYLKEDLSGALHRQLQQGELDLVVLAFPYPMPDMETLPIFRDDFLLCLPPGHSLEKFKQIKLQQLRGENLLLLQEGHCLRDHVLEACKLDSSETKLVYQGTSLHTLVQMVANGLGATLLPRLAAEADVIADTSLQLRQFNNENVSREVGLAWRKTDPRRGEYLLLAECIREQVAQMHSHGTALGLSEIE